MIAGARRWIDGLNATGGTNLDGAVASALQGATTSQRMALVFLLTDGLPSVGEQQPDQIAATAAGQIGQRRIFTIGVGEDVNTYLLDRLAVEGRGSATYVAPGADVGDAVGGVVAKLSRPALVDLRIVRAPVRFLDAAPAVLPDLFFGEELVVLARYRGTGSGPVVIEGSRNGRRERFTIQGTFAGHADGNEYIPQLWAARRIGELTRTIRIEGSSPAIIDEVRQLGLRYGILTEYTSYLVLEPAMQMRAMREEVAAPAGASAAGEMTGRQAFADADASAKLSGSTTLAGANRVVGVRSDEVARRSESERDADVGEARRSRRVGGRLFVWRGGAWTDVGHGDSLRVTSVAPFSEAYFALVKARPAIAQPLAVGNPLLLAGRRASLRVAEGGITNWAPGAMERFLREFDGR
jgi:Ca-activated chloride channel family protein